MNVLYGGYMDPETKLYPYTIIDMEQTFTNKDDAFGFIKSKVRGIMTKSIENIRDDYYHMIDCPIIYKDVIKSTSATSKAMLVADNGVQICVSYQTNYGRYQINGNNIFKTNNYTSSLKINDFSLYVSMLSGGEDVSMRYTATYYNDGLLLQNNIGNGMAEAVFWFDNDGIMYFTCTTTQKAHIGFFPKNSVDFSLIGALESLRIYAIRSVASYAEGKVTDKTGKPFKNARITALRRHNMTVAGEAISGDDGLYRMNLFALKGSELVMVCLDDDGTSPDFEAQIYDRVVVT